MQSDAPVQLTQVPPKPTCNPNALFVGSDCQDRINIYNQALQQRQREELQLYVNRQKQLASSQAVAPLQQEITELTKQVGKLQEQMKTDSAAALEAKSAAHMQGLEQGAGIGVAASLLIVGVILAFKKMMRGGDRGKQQARAVSA